jgi:hypothetical protein
MLTLGNDAVESSSSAFLLQPVVRGIFGWPGRRTSESCIIYLNIVTCQHLNRGFGPPLSSQASWSVHDAPCKVCATLRFVHFPFPLTNEARHVVRTQGNVTSEVTSCQGTRERGRGIKDSRIRVHRLESLDLGILFPVSGTMDVSSKLMPVFMSRRILDPPREARISGGSGLCSPCHARC